jgi:hypothetical protein
MTSIRMAWAALACMVVMQLSNANADPLARAAIAVGHCAISAARGAGAEAEARKSCYNRSRPNHCHILISRRHFCVAAAEISSCGPWFSAPGDNERHAVGNAKRRCGHACVGHHVTRACSDR